jgi:hypothetical protein
VLVFGGLLNAGEDKVARQHHGHDDDQLYLSQPSY